MKYLIVLLVVVGGLWLLLKRHGRSDHGPAGRRHDPPMQPMAQCARCGLHLPSVDAVLEGTRVYCCDEHRRLGPGPSP
jgi:uncharacterized protein